MSNTIVNSVDDGTALLPKLTDLKAIISGHYPELADSNFRLLTQGWDSVAVDVDDGWIFKFPKQQEFAHALVREANLLQVIRRYVTLPVPELTIIEEPVVFSRHKKIKGDYVTGDQYVKLPESSRQNLADKLALFYAEMHSIPSNEIKAAGVRPIQPWLDVETIYDKALPLLPVELKSASFRCLKQFEESGPDPYGEIYGFFDGHGWNMAFDYETGKLAGIYDFGDSGIGSLHQEFIYTNFISRDLTLRIVLSYERLTDQVLDGARIDLLSSVLRLHELAEASGTDNMDAVFAYAVEWFKEELNRV